jgi:deazaflavin-dependent oxidoreductase (nitroreductase family)
MEKTRDWQAYNLGIIEEFRANGGKSGLILLTTTGARSGEPRVVPLNYSEDGDRIIVIASKGGSPTHPDWYHNLLAHPEVTIERGQETYRAHAVVAQGAERQRLFDQQAAQWAFFAEYQKKTAREIPVIVFERIN